MYNDTTTRFRPIITVRHGYTPKDHLLDEIARICQAALQLGPASFPDEERALLAADRTIVFVIGSRHEYRGCSFGLVAGVEEIHK